MSLSTIKIQSFRQLLDQLVAPATLSGADVQHIHDFLFDNPLSCPISLDSEMAPATGYLREIIVSQGMNNLDELLSYFEKKSKKLDHFLDQLVGDQTVQTKDLPELNDDLLFPERHSGRLSSLFVTKSSQLVNNMFQLGDMKKIYTRIKEELDIQMRKASKCLMFKYLLPAEGESDINYIEQFSGHEKFRYVFVMKNSARHARIEVHDRDSQSAFEEWVIQHFKSRAIPEYGPIIDVIKREEPIGDPNFKFQILEWLIFSKIIISGCREAPSKTKKPVLFAESCFYPTFNSQELYYYSGHGFQSWITKLFEAKLKGKKWRILKRSADMFWLTSDNPGFLIHIGETEAGRKEGQLVHSLGEIRLDTVLYYPLSKDYCLRIEPNAALDCDSEVDGSSIEYEQCSDDEVDFVNRQTIGTDGDLIIANKRKILSQYIPA